MTTGQCTGPGATDARGRPAAKPREPRAVDVIAGREFQRLQKMGCPFCGRAAEPRELTVQFGMKAMIAECRACRIAYQTPRPSVEASCAYMDWRWASSDSYVADKEAQRVQALKCLEYVNGLFDRPGELLDFGAGIGTFVRAALENGWRATGVERSATAIARASQENGIEMAVEIGTGPYDAITLWDVIEHLRSPEETLAALTRVLRPGGFLLVETANWQSWHRLAHGDRWAFYLFDHQYYFSPSRLKALMADSGLSEFRLLNSETRSPGRSALRHPRVLAAYLRSRMAWPRHGSYEVLVAAGQRST